MKKLAITMGEPGGIGPEVIAKALNFREVGNICRPIVIGDSVLLKKAMNLIDSPLRLNVIKSPGESEIQRGIIQIIDVRVIPSARDSQTTSFKGGKPTVEGGKASVSYIRKAVELALAKQVDGVVTAPISKEALKMAGYKWPGHTEMLAEMTKTKDFAMMFAGGPLKVILVTIHIALKTVPRMVTKQRVLKIIRLAKKSCDMLGIRKPRIAVAGLNPHAGESGIFGDEEIKEIVPAINQAAREGISVSGPYPPDTIFHRAYKGDADIVVCMYHDQGLIPLKMIAFDKGVNVTVGLPFIRTSPDHGTAFDIAWKGIADPSSMIEAIKLAVRLHLA